MESRALREINGVRRRSVACVAVVGRRASERESFVYTRETEKREREREEERQRASKRERRKECAQRKDNRKVRAVYRVYNLRVYQVARVRGYTQIVCSARARVCVCGAHRRRREVREREREKKKRVREREKKV